MLSKSIKWGEQVVPTKTCVAKKIAQTGTLYMFVGWTKDKKFVNILKKGNSYPSTYAASLFNQL